MDDFELSCKGLYRAMTIREKYMRLAFQRFPNITSQYLREMEAESFRPEEQVQPSKSTRPLTLEGGLERTCTEVSRAQGASVPGTSGVMPVDARCCPAGWGLR